jgi:hypothetical protein
MTLRLVSASGIRDNHETGFNASSSIASLQKVAVGSDQDTLSGSAWRAIRRNSMMPVEKGSPGQQRATGKPFFFTRSVLFLSRLQDVSVRFPAGGFTPCKAEIASRFPGAERPDSSFRRMTPRIVRPVVD